MHTLETIESLFYFYRMTGETKYQVRLYIYLFSLSLILSSRIWRGKFFSLLKSIVRQKVVILQSEMFLDLLGLPQMIFKKGKIILKKKKIKNTKHISL